tara:strand:- start:804 stop:1262 length:459 start_codon:yes stop_codon:yes gene_type:complete
MTKVGEIKNGIEDTDKSKDIANAKEAAPPSAEDMSTLKGMMDKIGGQFGGARRGGARRTRGGRKYRSSLSRRRSYRRRVRSSPCRKKGPAVCRSMKNCKFVSKKRRYCRKGKNTRRRTRGGSKRMHHGGKKKRGHCSGGARRGGARRGGARR